MDAVTISDKAAENIRSLLDARGMTQARLAALAEMHVPDVSKLLKGGRATSLGTLAKVADALGTTVSALIDPAPPPYSLPSCGWIPGGKLSAPMPEHGMTNFNEMFAGGVYTLDVRGTSMVGAGIFDSDTVILRRCETASIGDIVAAVVNDERTLKVYGEHNGRPALLAFNDDFPPIILNDGDDVRIEGVVIGGAWTVKRRRWKPKPVRGGKHTKPKKK